jgi:hypothetical protein
VAAAVAASAVDRVASQVGLLLCAPFTGLRWRDLTGRSPAHMAPGEPVDELVDSVDGAPHVEEPA